MGESEREELECAILVDIITRKGIVVERCKSKLKAMVGRGAEVKIDDYSVYVKIREREELMTALVLAGDRYKIHGTTIEVSYASNGDFAASRRFLALVREGCMAVAVMKRCKAMLQEMAEEIFGEKATVETFKNGGRVWIGVWDEDDEKMETMKRINAKLRAMRSKGEIALWSTMRGTRL